MAYTYTNRWVLQLHLALHARVSIRAQKLAYVHGVHIYKPLGPAGASGAAESFDGPAAAESAASSGPACTFVCVRHLQVSMHAPNLIRKVFRPHPIHHHPLVRTLLAKIEQMLGRSFQRNTKSC